MIMVEFYGENNPEQLLPSMIKSKHCGKPIFEDGVIKDFENADSYPDGAVAMSIQELSEYETAHKTEWEAFLATYTPPEAQNE